MKELLCYIAQNLADNPDQVSVEAVMSGDAMTLQLRVAQEDMGKVIGRQGRIAKEIRTLLKAAGLRENLRFSLVIIVLFQRRLVCKAENLFPNLPLLASLPRRRKTPGTHRRWDAVYAANRFSPIHLAESDSII